MAFKLLSKNIMGGVTTLLLIILLTQSRVFDFLINTHLGRFFLILAILGISYCHKIFGVVALLFIIIIFNQSEISFLEGFTDTKTTSTDPSGNSTSNDISQKKDEAKNKIAQLAQQNATTTASSTAVSATAPISTETFMGREGFNTVDREGTILRGKRSNEVPVFSNARNQSDNVEASDKSVFSGSYGSI
jgi:hypothetical protein